MALLNCCIVGEGRVISIVIEDWKTVALLKDAIHEKKQYQFPADELQLFLAKNGNVWLSSDTEDVKKLKKGEMTALIEELMEEDQELQGESDLKNVLKDMDPPSTDQIHVLVACPQGQIVECDRVSFPTAVPTGPAVVTSSCENLLAFLESEMKDKKQTVSRPHILYDSRLQFRLVGRQNAIKTAAECFERSTKARGKSASDRTMQAMPVCSGISGLGKTRMLEEGSTILQEMKLKPDRTTHLIVPYYNGYNPTPVERSMPIEASFSWRLLYRFFLDGNCAFGFDKWFELRLPRNGSELTFPNAIEVVEHKLRQSVQGEKLLYIFLGIDEYQRIEEVGTDLGVIASGSIDNPSYYGIQRLPMTLLTLGQVVTAVESNAEFAGLVQHSEIRRNLYALGGVPRWVVEYLMELKKCMQPSDVKLEMIQRCFRKIWTKYVRTYSNSIETHQLVRLAAFAASGQQVDEDDQFDEQFKWSRLRDSSLCLLIPSAVGDRDICDVRVPYSLLHSIGSRPNAMTSVAEKSFAAALTDMRELVDDKMFDLEPWQSWGFSVLAFMQ